ncbi:type II toxin-antitoxin system Phd/YefM family antitoxin [Pseudomonas sp. 17391]|uniref:type II toxin-antitoxin system Phd/YefM family antitoxin n=1 Tax=Pseudomonas sp. 17391 TaxID=2967217 RepID=UPI00308231D1
MHQGTKKRALRHLPSRPKATSHTARPGSVRVRLEDVAEVMQKHEEVEMQVISATQARRRFRRLMRLLQEGNSFVITRHGKPVCKLEPPEVR